MPRYKTSDHDYYMAPEIYRYIRYIHGAPKFRILYQPAPNYARDPVIHDNTGKYIKSYAKTDENKAIYLYSRFPLTAIQQGEEFTLTQNEYILLSAHQNSFR